MDGEQIHAYTYEVEEQESLSFNEAAGPSEKIKKCHDSSEILSLF